MVHSLSYRGFFLSAFFISLSVQAASNTSYVMDGNAIKNVKELANSVEFEVYNISEDSSSRSVFISGAGVCHGFSTQNGVDLTNSTNYYVIPDNEDEYYGSIVGATIYQKGKAKNVQYVPVYAVSDPQKIKEIREQEVRDGKTSRERAQPQIDEAKDTLNKIICIH